MCLQDLMRKVWGGEVVLLVLLWVLLFLEFEQVFVYFDEQTLCQFEGLSSWSQTHGGRSIVILMVGGGRTSG